MRGLASRATWWVLVCSLVACSGSLPPRTYTVCMSSRPCFDASKDPYWEDPAWEKSLLDAIQSVAHDPLDPADMSTPGLRATVKFIYMGGNIEYPEIIHGTGDQEKDELLLHQLASAKVPQATGLQTDRPHQFELDVDMPTPLETFESAIYAAIEEWKVYPKNPILSGTVGDATVDFDYLDGKASNIVMATSSQSKELDWSSLAAVNKASMPVVPAAYAGKSLHLDVIFCYTIEFARNGTFVGIQNQCPTARNVIEVRGTRVERTETSY